MTKPLSIQTLTFQPGLQVAYTGPHLSSGPLPALFYFSLSAEDSLLLDPFNQPVVYLAHLPLRIFSLTLPGHEDQLPATEALHVWARELAKGHPVIAEFIAKVKLAIDFLLQQQALVVDKIAVAGLSRGAFIALHAAAEIPYFRWILGFSPLTQLAFAKEFQNISHLPFVHLLSAEHVIHKIYDRTLRFYIGNLDTRVSTRLCFDFIEKLATAAFKHHIRSPQVELIISPSIGRFGHGTPKKVFHAGAQWIAEQLGVTDVM